MLLIRVNESLLMIAGFVAPAIASISGFGIGSMLTPRLKLSTPVVRRAEGRRLHRYKFQTDHDPDGEMNGISGIFGENLTGKTILLVRFWRESRSRGLH
jgi:hypothetical protein